MTEPDVELQPSDYTIDNVASGSILEINVIQSMGIFNYVKWFYCFTTLCRIYSFIFNCTGNHIKYVGKMNTYAFINNLEIA